MFKTSHIGKKWGGRKKSHLTSETARTNEGGNQSMCIRKTSGKKTVVQKGTIRDA